MRSQDETVEVGPRVVRAVFFGSPEFAVPALGALLDAGHEIPLAVSQPAKPVGRRGTLKNPPVVEAALGWGIECFQPETLKGEAPFERIAALEADVFVVVAYGKILAPRYLALPRIAPINVHASILPRWRGASPIQAALLSGDLETGVSIMRMEAGMDTGPVYAMRRTQIGPSETHAELSSRLSLEGARLLIETFPDIVRGRQPEPQFTEGITYCPKIGREDGRVVWTSSAAEICRRGRAFHPWPGLFAFRKGGRIKLLGVQMREGAASGARPGEVVRASSELCIACGEEMVLVDRLQKEGRNEMPAAEFVRGERVAAGEIWE